MAILITGNQGYVGSYLLNFLNKKKGHKIFCLDTGFFKKVLTSKTSRKKINFFQINRDIRKFNFKEESIDTIVHLAAISNDPMGKNFKKVTEEINYKASVNLFNQAKSLGVKKFIFASSCSTYGFAGAKIKSEKSKTRPLTTYAKSKVKFEDFLKKNASKDLKAIVLRFATACGPSPRLRLDLVLNDFVYRAIKFKKIIIMSNGQPYRPLIDVRDMSDIISWFIDNEQKKPYLLLNAGSNQNNFKILDLAKKVKKIFKNKIKIEINSNAPDDRRSYKVNFNKLKKIYKSFKPTPINKTIINLKKDITKIVSDNKYQFNELLRLNHLNILIENKKITKRLYWNGKKI